MTLLAVCNAAPLLASNWQRMGDRFGANAGVNLSELLIVLGVCVAAAAAILLIRFGTQWWEVNSTKPNPARLHRELSSVHGLTGRQSALLKTLAELCEVEEPAEVFLRPELFAVRSLPEELVDRSDELDELAAVLFADMPAVTGRLGRGGV
ncbi:MAG: hypothetical protein AAGJ46_13655 [Planctomycetota bacterium]